MNLQYISDSNGKTTGVFIPIKEWNELKNKFKGIEEEETDIPSWHLDIVRERLEDYESGKEDAIDFDEAINDLEKDL